MTADSVARKFPFPSTSLYHPAPELIELAEKDPVTRVELPDGSHAWLITGFDEVRKVLIDPRFSRGLAAAPDRPQRGLQMLASASILGMDPPEHTRLRRLVAGTFTNRRIEALRPQVREIVTGLLDELVTLPRPADLVHQFSLPLPVQVICEMLGVPAEDRDRFAAWSDSMLGDWNRDTDEMMAAYQGLSGYLAGLIEAKRAAPADDLLTALIAVRDGSDRLSEFELVNLGISLLVGGHETTANQINMSLLTLLENPDELTRLREDPELIPAAVEELMRFVQLGGGDSIPMPRIAAEDVELGGVTIAAGDAVLALTAAANRDPAVFEDPNRLDLTRTTATHLAFGAGIHHCLGAQLARMELQEAYRGLLTRLPGLRLTVPVEELRFKPNMILRSLYELPVTWDDV